MRDGVGAAGAGDTWARSGGPAARRRAARDGVAAAPTALGERAGAHLPAPAPSVDGTVVADLRDRLAEGGEAPTTADLVAAVRRRGGVVGRADLPRLERALRAELDGAGPLQPLLDLPDVTDVLVNGPGAVWVDRGRGLEPVEIDLGGGAGLRALAVRLAASGGRRLDDASPAVDARLPDGTRLHVVLPPLAPQGPVLSLRVLRPTAFTLDDLVRAGTVPPVLAALLETLVRERASGLVSGATGSGKTTLLGTVLSLVPGDERIVCIEEAGELAPRHPHVVRLQSRPPNVEGAGEVTLADLVRQALRMRPDRLVLGECRGAEVREVLAALGTGHDGGWATLHAGGVREVPARLEAMGALARLDRAAVAAQTLSGVDVVVHLRRYPVRHVAEVGVPSRAGDGGLEVVPALRCAPATAGHEVVRGPAWPTFVERWGDAWCG